MSEQQQDQGKIEFWAVVELLGHQRMAGFVRQVSLGGDVLLRVDVPEVKHAYQPYGGPAEERTIAAFTRFVSPKALYALNPCTEEFARAAAAQFLSKPVELYSLSPSSLPALPAPSSLDDPDDFDIPDEDDDADDFHGPDEDEPF